MIHPENKPEAENPEASADSEQRRDATCPPDILDWDACLETPPPRPSGTIEVRLRFRGRDKPFPVEEPEDK